MFMFTEINCSGLKDPRFNEQLLLAALKTFVRDGERHREKERERRSPDYETYEATTDVIMAIMKHSFFTTFIVSQ